MKPKSNRENGNRQVYENSNTYQREYLDVISKERETEIERNESTGKRKRDQTV